MKRLLFIVLIFLAGSVLQISSAQNAVSAVKNHGALHVSGNRILDQHGIPPQLRGISLSWSIWEGKKYYNPDVINWLVSDFKANIIRVSMAVEPDDGYLRDPEGQKKLVYTVVDQAIKDGVYVLIDWHDHNADKNLEQSKGFFTEMAKK